MLSRKPCRLILSALLISILIGCNNKTEEVATQNSTHNYNRSIPNPTATPSPNTSIKNSNSNTFWPFSPNAQNKEREEELMRMARENKLKPPTYGNRCVSFIKKIEGHEQIEGVGMQFTNGSCKDFKYEVHLRGGKVCDLPNGKLINPLSASPEELLSAVGDCMKH